MTTSPNLPISSEQSPTPATPSPAPASPTPISDVNPQTLDYVFSKSPKDITDAELDVLVGTLREKRKLWHQQELTGAKQARGAAKAQLAPAKATLSLDDLEA